jgi:prevent-host-death family protein
MTATTLKDARENLAELVQRAQRGETVIIRQRGKPAVQMVAVPDESGLKLSAEEVRKLNAWADKERAAGQTRVSESPAAYVARRRTRKNKSR